MSLVDCKECKTKISTKAHSCPSCGAPQKSEPSILRFLIYIPIALGFLLWLGVLLVSSDPIKEGEPYEASIKTETPPTQIEIEAQKNDFAEFRNTLLNSAESIYLNQGPEGGAAALEKWLHLADDEYKEKWRVYQEEFAKSIPSNDPVKNAKAYQDLARYFPENGIYLKKNEHWSGLAEKEKKKLNADIHVLSWRWQNSFSYAITEGEVRNNTRLKLELPRVNVEFRDKDGNFITSDYAFLEYRPLMPGQSSPFKIHTTWNPAMKTANLKFQNEGKALSAWIRE